MGVRYAERLGITAAPGPDGTPECVLPPSPDVVGRPGYLHGGAIAGLLELAAYAAMEHVLDDDERSEIKPVGVTVEFMRNGNLVDTRATATVARVGSRFANVTARAWQDDPDRPIATAQMTFSLR